MMATSPRKAFYSDRKEISCNRVGKIQSHLASNRFNINCLLIIAGIDSRFNSGSRNVLEYILPGFNASVSKLTISSDSIGEDALDDLVICIRKGSIHAYCNPENYDLFISYAASWDNLEVYCLDKSEYDNHEDLSEELKISSLLVMVEGCATVAVPYNYGISSKYQSIPFDPMLIEQWPLIQAYALEEIGGGGFFTMKHQVVEGTEFLNDAFATLNQFDLENLVTQLLPQFEQQWRSLIESVSMVSDQNIGNLDRLKVEEPLKTYFHHGADERKLEGLSEPSVRFGVFTGEKQAELSKNGGNLLKESGIDRTLALHMVCEGKDSKGMVSCTRTYLIEPTVKQSNDGATKDEETDTKEIRVLRDCYELACEAFDLAVDEYKKTLDFAKCQDVAVQHIIKSAKERKSDFVPKKSDIDVTWKSVDQNGSENASITGTCKSLRIAINDIPSQKYQGKSLGSICFSDTFLVSTVNLKCVQERVSTECVLLTRGVPRFISWPTEKGAWVGKDVDIKEKFTAYGRCLMEKATAMLIVGQWPTFQTEEVTFYGFENCLILHHKQSGYLSFPLDLFVSWSTFDNDSISSITLLTIKPSEKLLHSLPFWLEKDNEVVVAFLPRSKAHAGFYDEAFHFWKENKNCPLKSCNDLPKEQEMMYDCLYERFRTLDEKMLPFARQLKVFPNLKRFFKHFEISSHTSQPLEEKDLNVLLTPANATKEKNSLPADDSELLLTIVTGLPGSGSETLCKTLISLAREASRWVAIKVPQDIKQSFDAKAFQDQLALTFRTLTQQKGRYVANIRKRRRLIIQTNGFVDVRDIIDAVQEHPDQYVRSNLKIGSVTCCVNPNNIFLRGRMHLPFLLEQCRSGFVSNAVFTSCTEPEKADSFSNCQRLIRYCNPEVSFLIAKGGEVSRTPDIELILSDSSFQESKALRARIFSDGKRSRHCENAVNQITLFFTEALDKTQFMSKIKHMKGKLPIDCQIQGTVLYMEGKVTFAGFPDVHEFKWSKLLGMTSFTVASTQLSPRPPSSRKSFNGNDQEKGENHVTFFGLGLCQDDMKGLMQTWTMQRKSFLKREDISKEILEDIKVKHKLEPLPAGWFFNGSQYLNFEGEKMFDHPSFEKHVDEYIQKVNKEITSYNDRVAQQHLFAD
ncbi:dynein axonemal assembly factor 9-like [Rhopilema esculentum]|uniref:dynein axonemal assembly factor 9-like n=1 Tax=Rhopilema esculentum TaxID=499914 RepID=UPI0031D7D0FF